MSVPRGAGRPQSRRLVPLAADRLRDPGSDLRLLRPWPRRGRQRAAQRGSPQSFPLALRGAWVRAVGLGTLGGRSWRGRAPLALRRTLSQLRPHCGGQARSRQAHGTPLCPGPFGGVWSPGPPGRSGSRRRLSAVSPADCRSNSDMAHILVQSHAHGPGQGCPAVPFSWRIRDYVEELWVQAQYISAAAAGERGTSGRPGLGRGRRAAACRENQYSPRADLPSLQCVFTDFRGKGRRGERNIGEQR